MYFGACDRQTADSVRATETTAVAACRSEPFSGRNGSRNQVGCESIRTILSFVGFYARRGIDQGPGAGVFVLYCTS
jgi:hypothetical protein